MKKFVMNKLSRALHSMIGALVVMLMTATPAMAQIAKATAAVDYVKAALLAVGLGVMTIAIMYAAFQVMYNKKRLDDMGNLLIGGILFGAAPTIASFFVG